MSLSLTSPLLVAPPFVLAGVALTLDFEAGGTLRLAQRLSGMVDLRDSIGGNVALGAALSGSVDLTEAFGGTLHLARTEEGRVDL